MPHTATIPAIARTPKTARLRPETAEERNIRLYGCPYDHTPNAETIEAIEEGDAILRGEIPSISMSVDDFFKEMGCNADPVLHKKI